MDEMQAFIWRQNIELFVNGLEIELDPALRTWIRRLLVEEENKFLEPAEKLCLLEQHVERAAGRIHEQRSLIDGIDDDLARARRVLINLEDIHRLFIAHRQTLIEGLGGEPTDDFEPSVDGLVLKSAG